MGWSRPITSLPASLLPAGPPGTPNQSSTVRVIQHCRPLPLPRITPHLPGPDDVRGGRRWSGCGPTAR
eukprot:432981-Hanusia_phi.AAC.1